MVEYKLYYFNTRGAGEPARLIFHYAGQKFEDIRLTPEEFGKDYKSKMPNGQLPVLEVDGKLLPESMAIFRYLGRKFGLAGKDEWEEAQIDALCDSYLDFMQEKPAFRLVVTLGEAEKEALMKEKFVPATEKYFPIYKKYLAEAANGFFFKCGPTWFDFYLAEMHDSFNNYIPDFYQNHPEFKAHSEKVHSLQQLQNYLKTRPETKH